MQKIIPDYYNDLDKVYTKIWDLLNLGLKDISMGMSNDYTEALSYKSTYIRIGTKIFGRRG